MKLIDMLVDAGLNKGFEWPDDFYYCAQDGSIAKTLTFCDKVMEIDVETFSTLSWISSDYNALYHEMFIFNDLADDYKTSQITKQEYLVALEKAKKEGVSKAELDEPKEAKLNSIAKVDIVLEPEASIPCKGIWYLPDMLTEYSRKKESFGLLEKELDEKRKELYELQENIRTLCEQQGWRIEPV